VALGVYNRRVSSPDSADQRPPRPSQPTRRGLLQGAGLAGLGIAGVLDASACGTSAKKPSAAPTPKTPAPQRSPTAAALPAPEQSGIEHVVVQMMENRSFDHFLGWLPGADGRQSGLSFIDLKGAAQETYHLTKFQGCGFADPDHSVAGGHRQFNGGRCDGWLKTPGVTDTFPVGYYTADDLPFIANAAREFTTCDRYFASLMGPTYPNRIYMHAAQTDRQSNTAVACTLPTIWDRLAAAKVSGGYYYSDLPFIALWGSKHLNISKPYATFLRDCKAGTLPAVSFVDPRFAGEGAGTSGDDHPLADIRVGERFLADVYEAVTASPAWSKTVLVINFDEWGGFFDHVPPGTAPDVNPANTRRGFRVPALVISPLARRGHVAHGVYEHTSVLKMIEWRWGLEPLTVRDAAARNLAEVLDFQSKPNLSAPRWTVPTVIARPCPTAALSRALEWGPVLHMARTAGMLV
jgi:phospholipase C